MAWLELPPSGVFHVALRYGGRKLKRSLDTGNPQLAERARLRVEDNLRLVEEGRLDIPTDADVLEFLLSDGKLCLAGAARSLGIDIPFFANRRQAPEGERPKRSAEHEVTTSAAAVSVRAQSSKGSGSRRLQHRIEAAPLGRVMDEYLAKLPEHALSPETLRVAKIHFGHLKRILGADTPIRPAFEELQREIFGGRLKTVVVWKLDRISRRLRDGINLLGDWCEQGVRVVVVTQQIDLNGAVGRMVASVLFGLAEIELEYRRERQAAGINVAKERGVYRGRIKGSYKTTPARAAELKGRGLTVREIAAALGVSERTAFRYLMPSA